MTHHFRQRVTERIPGEDPDFLWQGLAWAIENARTDLVQYIGRQDRKGLRLFRFRSATNGREYHVAVNTELMVPITVIGPDPEHIRKN